MTLKNICFSALLFFIVYGCTNNPLNVDASQIKVDLTFVNVDSVLMNADSTALIAAHNKFKNEIKDIYSYEIGMCLQIGDVEDSAFFNSISEFRKDASIQLLSKNIAAAFKDKTEIESKITDGFKHLKYHFPKGKAPKNIVYLNTLLTSGVFCTETEIGIGLERFLGDSSEFIQKLNSKFYFDWMKKAMDAKYLERDVLTGWIITHYVEEESGNLAEQIIRWGKILYLTEATFPEETPELIMRYTKEDYEWALENEASFWKYLVDEKLLFKIDERTTRNMLAEGPFTPGLPDQEGPDRLGQFLGWRMVHKYMEKNEISLEELVKLSYNDILQEYEIE